MTRELNAAEVDALLEEAGAGVLSLTDGAETYAAPMSFGYDGEALYLQFVYDEDSEKMAHIESTEVATLTVYTESPPKSVLVRGELERVSEDDQTHAATAIAENAEVPTLNVLPDMRPGDLAMAFYRLVPSEVSGRNFAKTMPAAADD